MFSGQKEDSRISEASRRVVQEEEERLILQKEPLQSKLMDISQSSFYCLICPYVYNSLCTVNLFGYIHSLTLRFVVIVAVVKCGLKGMSNDVEKCLSLVRLEQIFD